jgi:hypothetical protein
MGIKIRHTRALIGFLPIGFRVPIVIPTRVEHWHARLRLCVDHERASIYCCSVSYMGLFRLQHR